MPHGAFVENYAAQELMAGPLFEDVHLRELYYWTGGSTAEVDFIVFSGETVYPLEVKAGTRRGKASLKVYGEKYSPPVLSRATLMNFKRDGMLG